MWKRSLSLLTVTLALSSQLFTLQIVTRDSVPLDFPEGRSYCDFPITKNGEAVVIISCRVPEEPIPLVDVNCTDLNNSGDGDVNRCTNVV